MLLEKAAIEAGLLDLANQNAAVILEDFVVDIVDKEDTILAE